MSNEQDQKAPDRTESKQDQQGQATSGQSVEQPDDALIAQQDPEETELQPQQQAQTEDNDNIDRAALLADALKQIDSYKDDLLRAHADMENLRRRQARDLENAHKRALDKFVEELLPVCDSMDLGLKAADSSDASLASVRDGLEMTMKMFLAAIAKFGLEEVNPEESDTFNPDLHQAMQIQEAEGVPAGQVVTVVQKGYQLNGRLLRPAMVVVSA